MKAGRTITQDGRPDTRPARSGPMRLDGRAGGVPAFRDVLAHVATPVSVVTTAESSGKARGVTVGTLCSLSFAPPLVMFCLDRSGGSHEVMTTAPRVLIHVLRDDQSAVAARFSRAGIDRFAGLSGDWHGLPTIPDTAIRLACNRYANVPAGDHTIVMCLVTDAEIGTGKPLLYYAREYCSPLPCSFLRRKPSQQETCQVGGSECYPLPTRVTEAAAGGGKLRIANRPGVSGGSDVPPVPGVGLLDEQSSSDIVETEVPKAYAPEFRVRSLISSLQEGR
jgi:flavin reductase ActVB